MFFSRRFFLLSLCICLFSLITAETSVFGVPSKQKASASLYDASGSYTGPVEHIFFHPLIIYPEIAFPKSRKRGYICDWFVTLAEFNQIITELYQRNYVLVSMKDVYEIKGNSVVRKAFPCPAGKKPLIISIDDVNYYKTMQTHGMTKQLVIRKGKIVSLANSPTGERVVERGEVMTVVDAFVAAHPDFSYKGAKGIMALTGYNGVFGYPTHKTTASDYLSQKAEAIRVAELFKKTGWEFASHGYRHLQEGHISAAKLEADAKRWREEVEPIIGSTPYHIYPFGDIIMPGKPEIDVLRSYGFKYFFGVSFSSTITEHGSWVYQHRIPIDGKYMMGIVSGSRTKKFMDIAKDVDPMRVQYFMK